MGNKKTRNFRVYCDLSLLNLYINLACLFVTDIMSQINAILCLASYL